MSACRMILATVVFVALASRFIDGFVMPALSEADVRAVVERNKRAQPGNCQLHPFNVSVVRELEGQQCVGSIPAFGCAGRCETTQTPHYYMSRHEANIADPWISSCKCCSHTHKLSAARSVSLLCRDGRVRTTIVPVLMPIDCGCTACS